MSAPQITDTVVLAVLHRAFVDVVADPRATGDARAPQLSAAHIAHAMTLPETASLLRMPTWPAVAPEIGARVVHCLLRLKHLHLVAHERRVVRGVVQDLWAITLEGMARARRDAAA